MPRFARSTWLPLTGNRNSTLPKRLLRPPERARGFTLIEVMTVVFIIAIVINLVSISMGRNTPADRLKEEADRLTSLIQLASEEALLRSVLIGVDIAEDHYGFLSLSEEGNWETVDDTLFRDRELPEPMTLSIATSLKDGDNEEKRTPEIILMNSGEMTPFEMKISSRDAESYYRLTGNEVGELALEHVSPY
ncbi:MAG: type II secretion system minor pseudopilin GspH [Candidatus Thiodiazotropha sp.]|jgi:general secretion pathway protein H